MCYNRQIRRSGEKFLPTFKATAPPPAPPRLRPHRTLTWRVRQIKPLGEARTATVGEDESASARRRGKTPDSPRLEELPRRAGSGRAPAHPRLWRVRSAAAPASTAPQRQAELGTVRGVRGPRLLHQPPPPLPQRPLVPSRPARGVRPVAATVGPLAVGLRPSVVPAGRSPTHPRPTTVPCPVQGNSGAGEGRTGRREATPE